MERGREKKSKGKKEDTFMHIDRGGRRYILNDFRIRTNFYLFIRNIS